MLWHIGLLKHSYQPLKEEKDPEEFKIDDELGEAVLESETTKYGNVDTSVLLVVADSHDSSPRNSRFLQLVTFIILTSLGLVLLSGIVIHLETRQLTNSHIHDQTLSENEETSMSSTSNNNCSKRREWRTLSVADKHAYLNAFKCLSTQPSILGLKTPNVSAYSDFPYVHAHVGYRTHGSAPFLPWHRYFLHIYETTLRSTCGYKGELVYWDWTIDADDLAASPVFDSTLGFGGNGDINRPITVGNHGRCVTDGPFAGLQALWYDVKYQPHCLSRGFRNDHSTGSIDGKDVSQASINEVMQLDDYEQFVLRMESKVHDAIPFGVGGDFETFSAPFDPLFYLHHVQLDRLWWLWQQQNDSKRLLAYGGRNGRHTIQTAQVSDLLHIGRLAPAIEVAKVMDTSGGDNMLCYTY